MKTEGFHATGIAYEPGQIVWLDRRIRRVKTEGFHATGIAYEPGQIVWLDRGQTLLTGNSGDRANALCSKYRR